MEQQLNEVGINFEAIEIQLRSPVGLKLEATAKALGVKTDVLRKAIHERFGKDNIVSKRGRNGGTFIKG